MSESRNASGGNDLVPVHGGLDDLVDRMVPLGERKKFLVEAESLPSLRVTNLRLSEAWHQIGRDRRNGEEHDPVFGWHRK